MANYFNNGSKKTELNELTQELNNPDIQVKLEALKKVIAQMTVGKDVSQLFQTVIRCLEFNDIALKKLVYLYIINYSQTKPDDAIMVINLFCKDVKKGTPLIKALAVRTMGCLRVKKLNEYLIEPLQGALNDDDAYVRKTAVLCVPKVYELNPEMIDESGLIQRMQDMLQKENNSLVMSNLVVSLYEISQIKGQSVLTITPNIIHKLLICVNECVEWGQLFILDCLTNYIPESGSSAESICERIVPRLSHYNPGVVLSTIKVLLKMMDYISDSGYVQKICQKITQPLVTLVNWDQPEIQYVILRNIFFILQKQPLILQKEIKVFFVKFNDPYYIKLEKINILIQLCDGKNHTVLLNELKEYANEIDPELVRKAIQAIGKISIIHESAVNSCIDILLNLYNDSKESSQVVVNEILVVFQNIYRKYPQSITHKNSLAVISDCLDSPTDVNTKCVALWILGEYCDQIYNSISVLEKYIENFLQDDRTVQLQMITAAVKIFLRNPIEAQEVITNILNMSTQQISNPDIRDKAYIYWRMLSEDPEKTRKVILGERPSIKEENYHESIGYIDKMISNMGLISSVLHKYPETIFSQVAVDIESVSDHQQPKKQNNPQQISNSNNNIINNNNNNNNSNNDNNVDLMDLLDMNGSPNQKNEKNQQKQQDLFEVDNNDLLIVLTQNTNGSQGNQGLQIKAKIQSETKIELHIQNSSQHLISNFQFQIKPNFLGLQFEEKPEISIQPREFQKVEIKIGTNGKEDFEIPQLPFQFKVGLKCSLDIWYFNLPIDLNILLTNDGKLTKDAFMKAWKAISEQYEQSFQINNVDKEFQNLENLKQKLQKLNIFFLAQRKNDHNQNVLYFSSKSIKNFEILIEICVDSESSFNISIKCKQNFIPKIIINHLEQIIKTKQQQQVITNLIDDLF